MKVGLAVVLTVALGVAPLSEARAATPPYISGGVDLSLSGSQTSSYGWADLVLGTATTHSRTMNGTHYIYDVRSFAAVIWKPYSVDLKYRDYAIGGGSAGRCYRGSLTAKGSAPSGSAASNSFTSGQRCVPAPSPPPGECQPGSQPPPSIIENDGEPEPVPPQCTSPIILDLEGKRGDFPLSGSKDPVRFDLDGNGKRELTQWTKRGDHGIAFLVLPDSEGRVVGPQQLFGEHTKLFDGDKAVYGYNALAEWNLPTHGGNFNGGAFRIPRTGRETPQEETKRAFDEQNLIDPQDAVWQRLRLWVDENHNGEAEPNELQTLDQAGVLAISHDAENSRRVDRFGNEFRLKSRFWVSARGEPKERGSYDVWFVRVGE